MSANDLTNHTFGRLTAIEPTVQRVKTSVVWRCRCSCGKEVMVPSDWLRRGLKKSCGCLQDERRRADITGQVRGHLTAIAPTDDRRGGHTIWMWRCNCGQIVRKTPQMVGDHKSTMCPDCARRLKKHQAYDMGACVEKDEYGRSVKQVKAIIAGKPTRQNSSGVRGVSWHRGSQKWCARITDGKGGTRTIGYYSTIEEAAKARSEAVARYYQNDAP